MEKLLSDHSKFFKIDFNPKYKINQHIKHLLDIKFEIRSRLDDLYDHIYLSKNDYKFLKPCDSKPGVMYGMCKVHKVRTDNDGVPPFRPILSATGTCNYNLVKCFVPIWKQFTINEYTVKDSFPFCKEILDQDPNLFMASFDIQSLFTNIPLDEAIGICVDMVFENRKKIKGMLKRHFK